MKDRKMDRRTFIKTVGTTGLAVSAIGFPAVLRGAEKEVEIGCVYPLSGGAGAMGNNAVRGWHIAVDEINASGGIKSLGGAKIKTLLRDTQSNPRTGMSEIEKLARNKNMPVVVGCWQSAVTFPATQVSEQYGLPHIVAVSTQPKICQRGFKYVFRLGPNSEVWNAQSVKFIEEVGKKTGHVPKRAALLSLDDNYGRSCAADYKTAVAKTDQEIVAELYYPPKATNIDVEIAKLKSAKPDVLYLTSYITDALLIVKALHSHKLDTFGNISGGAGYVDPKFLKMAGPLADYMYNGALWNYDLSRPDEKALDAELQKRYKVKANHHSGLMYSCVYLIKDVLERAGTTDREKVREALAKTDITSGKALTVPTRFIRFDENGENTGFDILAIQCMNGNYRTVWPQSFKSTEPVWPVPKWSERKI